MRGDSVATSGEKGEVDRDLTATYNEFKTFEGKRYTGMKVGGRHKWYYDAGEWKEKKVAPDRWEFTYAVPKRRAGKAPPGSGVPEGTEYHWYILAHQNVRKMDENTYTTAMTGVKIKLAHKRADKGTWSASDRAQRRALVKILKEMIADLERDPEAGPSPAAPTTGDLAAAPAPKPRKPRRTSPRPGTRRSPARG
jgi:hypothetical protein